MTIKLLIQMITAFAMLMAAPAIYSASMSTKPPRDAVSLATDIAIGVVQVSREGGLVVRFQPKEVLKGNFKTDHVYIVNYESEYARVRMSGVMEKIAAYAEKKSSILFLGSLHSEGDAISPNSFEGAIWPREHESDPFNQTPDTLEECVTFVKALLANPNLKLKVVNGRRVLPDNYILRGAATEKKAEVKKIMLPQSAKNPKQTTSTQPNKLASNAPMATSKEPPYSWSMFVLGGGIFVLSLLLWLAFKRRNESTPNRLS